MLPTCVVVVRSPATHAFKGLVLGTILTKRPGMEWTGILDLERSIAKGTLI